MLPVWTRRSHTNRLDTVSPRNDLVWATDAPLERDICHNSDNDCVTIMLAIP